MSSTSTSSDLDSDSDSTSTSTATDPEIQQDDLLKTYNDLMSNLLETSSLLPSSQQVPPPDDNPPTAADEDAEAEDEPHAHADNGQGAQVVMNAKRRKMLKKKLKRADQKLFKSLSLDVCDTREVTGIEDQVVEFKLFSGEGVRRIDLGEKEEEELIVP